MDRMSSNERCHFEKEIILTRNPPDCNLTGIPVQSPSVFKLQASESSNPTGAC